MAVIRIEIETEDTNAAERYLEALRRWARLRDLPLTSTVISEESPARTGRFDREKPSAGSPAP